MRLDKIYARDYGILPNQTESQKEQLERMFREAADGTMIQFEPGNYFMECQFCIREKKDLTICGNSTVFVSHYEPDMGNGQTPGLFYFQDCENLTLKGLDITTDCRANCTGYVVEKDIEGGTYVFRPASDFTMTGRERVMAQNSFDEEGTPDYHLFCYQENSYEVLGNGDIRIKLTENPTEQLMRLELGQEVCIRHTVYGKEHFIFENCRTVHIEDVKVFASPGSVVKILPHCADFSFLRFRIQLPEGSGRLMSSNADGIHVKGLSGSLSIKDCYFEHLGDDALNIHSRAAVVTEVDNSNQRIHCVSGWHDEKLYEMWAETSSVLEVYNPDNFLKKAAVVVESCQDGCIHYSCLEGEIQQGDILANSDFFASVHINGCTVRNSRARGFLIQSRNVLIENCTLYGLSLAAILIAPDIDYWYEVGPAKNIVIRNNLIEKCAIANVKDNLGVIIVKASHGEGYDTYPCGVHQDIAIVENEFEHNTSSIAFVSATDGVTITGNQIEKYEPKLYEEKLCGQKSAIVLQNCNRIVIGHNKTGISEKMLLSFINCTNYQKGLY